MKYLYLAIVLVFDVSVADVDICNQEHFPFNPELDLQWKAYIDNYKKEYSSETTHRYRRCIWEINIAEIRQHNNAGSNTFTMAVNQFTDMTFNEYAAMHQMNIKLPQVRYTHVNLRYIRDADVPESVDWRQKEYVTPIKNQGTCGSCWAFSATGAIEGQNAKKTKKLVNLSEQNLVDCAKNGINKGCKGGDQEDAFKYYVNENNGVNTEVCYPYTATNGSCKFNSSKECIGAYVTGYSRIAADESSLQKAVATYGPVSVSIVVTNVFREYGNGTFNDSTCNNKTVNHAVLVVGYTSEYWIVKNCHGTTWGMNGYIHIIKGRNMCKIASDAVYPTTSTTPNWTSGSATTYIKHIYLYVSFLFVANRLNTIN